MTQIDQFESIFRAASHRQYEHEDWQVAKILTICDGDSAAAQEFESNIRDFVSHAIPVSEAEWKVVPGNDFDSVSKLVELVEQFDPDLICSHRYLHVAANDFPYSLGTYIDVLTQVAEAPVLLLPHPSAGEKWHEETGNVMALTDHLTSDATIVHAAIKLTAENGNLFLTHIEDNRALNRILEAIKKIPELDSEIAEQKIVERLLLEPQHFIESCRSYIQENEMPFEVESIVKVGRGLNDCKRLIEEHRIDLLVMHTKDDEQLAMHGLAYPLTVELRHVPMLLI